MTELDQLYKQEVTRKMCCFVQGSVPRGGAPRDGRPRVDGERGLATHARSASRCLYPGKLNSIKISSTFGRDGTRLGNEIKPG